MSAHAVGETTDDPTLAAARVRWLVLQEELLRGATHALSNRVATLSAAAYMLEYEDVTAAQAAASLRTETERLDALLQVLRQLPSRGEVMCEPVSAMDVVTQAVQLHAQHCDLRDLPVTSVAEAEVLPCWVDPHVLLQALLLALTTVKRQAAGTEVRVQVSGDGDVTRLAVWTEPAHEPDGRGAHDVQAADRLLAHAEARARWREAGGVELVLPTLLAARRAGR